MISITGRIEKLKNKQAMLIHTDQDCVSVYDKYKNQSVLIQIDCEKKRRSLNANAYFHVLAAKLATKLEISQIRAKNLLISRYGQYELDGSEIIILRTDKPYEEILEYGFVHLSPSAEPDSYIVMRGTHTYNTAEMSRLIAGTVSECKECGMIDSEIASPDEIRKLNEVYGICL